MSLVQVDISAVKKQMESLTEMPRQTKTAFRRAIKETVRHAKAIIAKEVRQEYNISSGDVKGNAVNITTNNSSDGAEITYKGRTLTLVHFHFTPKTPRQPSKHRYRVRAKIKKERVLVGRKVFIGPTGTTSEEKIAYIPFKRIGKERLPIMPVHSVSVPQMITNKKVDTNITGDLSKFLINRFEHQYNAIMNGWTKEKQ